MTDPSAPLPDSSAQTPTDDQIKLRELTTQSWNLELVISGAALFATLSLPELLDGALTYYRYNLMPDTDYVHDMLPTLVLGLSKGVSYVLFVAFLLNFVMRAFWVGLVGLLAVYPDGIRYEQIYNMSEYARQRFAREMGSLDEFIIRLDRRCNVIFALAFALALLLFGIAAAYLIFIGIGTLLQVILPPDTYTVVRTAFGWLVGCVFLLYMLAGFILNLPKFRDNPDLAPISFRLSQPLNFLGIHRPLLYITYTFYSQIPKPQLQRRLYVVFAVFFLTEAIFIGSQTLQTRGVTSILDSRSFISLRDSSRTLNANTFDNLRPADNLIDKASIQADVIREPFVRLFVGYPKILDSELSRRYKEPAWPDSLSRRARRERRAAWYLQTFQRYFGVYVNDSLYKSPDFLFTQRPDNEQRGLTTVLLPTNLKPGKNIIRLTVPGENDQPAETYALIQFWYVPEP
ncbi:hypothetical protein [Spirosoma fluminis]